jgi:hypothetical protein
MNTLGSRAPVDTPSRSLIGSSITRRTNRNCTLDGPTLTTARRYTFSYHPARVVRLDTSIREGGSCKSSAGGKITFASTPAPLATTTPTSDQLEHPAQTDFKTSRLGSLPPKLIFRILDFMKPHEYSGFSCACRETETLINRKLGNF